MHVLGRILQHNIKIWAYTIYIVHTFIMVESHLGRKLQIAHSDNYKRTCIAENISLVVVLIQLSFSSMCAFIVPLFIQ